MTTKAELRDMHDADDAEMSAYLHGLEDADWDKPSLCDGWRVRDVVGHILYGNEMKLSTLPLRLARYGFSSDRSGKAYSIARAQGRKPADLLEAFDRRDRWAGTGRIFPPHLVLLDRLAHHQDIRRALGHQRTVPADRLMAVLEPTPRLGTVFGAKARTKGLRFEATDIDWSWGDGPPVRGPGEALFMAMLGRDQALGDLHGDGLSVFVNRFAS